MKAKIGVKKPSTHLRASDIPSPPTTPLQRMISGRHRHADILEILESGVPKGAIALMNGMTANGVHRLANKAGYVRRWAALSKTSRKPVTRTWGRSKRLVESLNAGGQASEILRREGIQRKGLSVKARLRRNRIEKTWIKLPFPVPEPLEYARGTTKLLAFERNPELAQQVRDFLWQHSEKYRLEVSSNLTGGGWPPASARVSPETSRPDSKADGDGSSDKNIWPGKK